MRRVFVVPFNDAEAWYITELLKRNNEIMFITKQKWGASWAELELNIINELVKYHNDKYLIYGVELQGIPDYINVVNIDHHRYKNENRYSTKSSLEQVAEIIGVNLSKEEMFAAANDNGYIPKMLDFGKILEMCETDISIIVDKIRSLDRMMQGVTKDDEALSISAIKDMEWLDYRFGIVRQKHSKASPVTDYLYAQYDELIILSAKEVNYFGRFVSALDLQDKFGGWVGGDEDSGTGFWGNEMYGEVVVEYFRNNLKNKDKLI